MILLLLACQEPKPTPGDDTGGGVDTADSAPPDDTGETGTDDPWAATQEELRRSIRQTLRSAEASGAQVAVWLDGEIVWSEGIGTRDPDTEDPVLTTTLFEIGSDTKKLTALALLQQVDAGKVTLDTTVAELLPDWDFPESPDWAATTTVHELISHQGGLTDYTPFDDVPDDAELEGRWYGRMGPEGWAMMPSGIAYNYSNPNFTLAGLLTERLDGARAWADIVEQDLFAPMGLERTYAREAEAEADGDYAVGTGYYLGEEGSTFYPLEETLDYRYGRVPIEEHPDNGFTRPAGLVWSTAEDMVRVGAFLIDGNPAVLSDALREQVTTLHAPAYPDVDWQGYGYGVVLLPNGYSSFDGWKSAPLWLHGGNTLSYTSTWCALPEQRVVVSILSNGYGDPFLNDCVLAAEAFVTLPDGGEPPELFAPPADLSTYTGTWVDPHAVGRIELTTDGVDLFVSMPDLEAMGYSVGETLTVYGDRVFAVNIAGAMYELLLYDGEDGDPGEHLVNRLFVGERVDGAAAAPPRGSLRGLPKVVLPAPVAPIGGAR